MLPVLLSRSTSAPNWASGNPSGGIARPRPQTAEQRARETRELQGARPISKPTQSNCLRTVQSNFHQGSTMSAHGAHTTHTVPSLSITCATKWCGGAREASQATLSGQCWCPAQATATSSPCRPKHVHHRPQSHQKNWSSVAAGSAFRKQKD